MSVVIFVCFIFIFKLYFISIVVGVRALTFVVIIFAVDFFCGILFPDEGQEELIRKTMGCKRFVYNFFLDERIKAYNEDKHSISYVDQQNQLPLMKQDPRQNG